MYVRILSNNILMKHIYNLFSCFGNISKIIYIKDKFSALVEYETEEYASKAKNNLNDVTLMNFKLKVS